jgi:FAD/FMN-containing dehydrogenase
MSPKYVAPEEYRDINIAERGWFYDWCTVENLDSALKELKEVLGDEWATNDLTIRNNYSRDQSIRRQMLPHIVVLPSSTEEVSGVMRVAYKHSIPVQYGSCRINQAGTCVPIRGGVMVDLVRMDKILELDEENMYATVQPFVDWAQLQIEGEKLGYWEGRALHGCEPEAPSSASVIGNTLVIGLSKKNTWYGSGANRIVSITAVLPDEKGTVVKLGSESIPNAGKVGGVHGPGMDLPQAFCGAAGRSGIITDLTVEIFPWGKYRRMYAWASWEKNYWSCIDFFYKLTRLDICQIVLADAPETPCVLAHILTPTYQEAENLAALISGFGDTSWVCGVIVHAFTQKELDAKCRWVEKLSEETEGAPTMIDMSFLEGLKGMLDIDSFLGRLGGIAQWMRKTRNTINYFRNKENWGCNVNFIHQSNAPRYYSAFLDARRRHFGRRDPWEEEKAKLTSHLWSEDTEQYLQPYHMGRNVIFEHDFMYTSSNPYRFLEQVGLINEMCYRAASLGMGPSAVYDVVTADTVYAELYSKVRSVFDPKDLLTLKYDTDIETTTYKTFGL